MSTSDTLKPLSEYPVLDILGPPPPRVKSPYDPADALDDLPGVRYALSCFLASHMIECEDWCISNDPDKNRLYFTSGYGLIQTVKGLMSYEDEDLLSAINDTKHGTVIASQHRKKPTSVLSKVASYVTSTSSVSYIKGMTPIERHAELVFAETTFEKALLGIVYSGDWFHFVREGLAMRSAISVYRSLYKYQQAVDAEHPSGKDPAIDEDFRSGVLLGTGLTSLVLTLLPSRVLSIVELFGYKGDRMGALKILESAGGWTLGESEPKIGIKEEGVRRPLCDASLLLFHLVMSSLTFSGISLPFATQVLEWNLKRYPNGVFYLFASGRLALQSCQPKLAVVEYTKAMECQSQYRNLHYISYWEISMAAIALWDLPLGIANWAPLQAEATWSRATYAYGAAATMLEIGGEDKVAEARKLIESVSGLAQKIAGKSIPIEKFVSRKSRRFLSFEGQRSLVLPLLEFGYLFQCIAHAPLEVLVMTTVPLVHTGYEKVTGSDPIAKDGDIVKIMKAQKEMKSGKGVNLAKGYTFDDYALVRFLAGIVWRYIAFPDPDAALTSRQISDGSVKPDQSDASSLAKAAFEEVLDIGLKIELDHYLVYHAHYELGRLKANLSDEKEARKHLEIVLSGKPLEASSRKGKYSMENTLIMRTTAAVDALDTGRKV